jgi:hypothetical protein
VTFPGKVEADDDTTFDVSVSRWHQPSVEREVAHLSPRCRGVVCSRAEYRRSIPRSPRIKKREIGTLTGLVIIGLHLLLC